MDRALKRWACSGTLIAAWTLGWVGMSPRLGLAADRTASASHPRQGSGIKITLDRDFVDKYADRVTMETDYVVDRVSPIHPASQDGEVHIAGKALEAKLPTVAELTNPQLHRENVEFFRDLSASSDPEERTVRIQGVWRFWCEHAGTKDQVQGAPLPARFPTSNPDHVFEIHPITGIKDRSLLDTFRPIEGFEAKDAHRAFLAYENAPCHITVDHDTVTLATRVVGFNFVEFILRPSSEEDPLVVSDGRFVMCQVFETDGELIARRRRMVFVKGTESDKAVQGLGDGRMRVIGLPRINLRLVQWRIENASNPQFDHPLDWDLPYEIVVIGLVKVLPSGNDD